MFKSKICYNRENVSGILKIYLGICSVPPRTWFLHVFGGFLPNLHKDQTRGVTWDSFVISDTDNLFSLLYLDCLQKRFWGEQGPFPSAHGHDKPEACQEGSGTGQWLGLQNETPWVHCASRRYENQVGKEGLWSPEWCKMMYTQLNC